MNKSIKVLQAIAEDAERDALSLDGRPFDGRTVSTQFGQIYASIKALAGVLERHLKNVDAKDNPILKDVVNQFMEEMLVELAGTVCTPEQGYIKDGGLNLLKSDIKCLVDNYNRLHQAAWDALTKINDCADGKINFRRDFGDALTDAMKLNGALIQKRHLP